MKLTLTEWAHVAEILGAVAVIASLIFVGVQVGENSREVRAATYQAVADNDMTVLSEFIANEGLALDYQTFIVSPERLEQEEMSRVIFLATMLLRSFENTYEQFQAGVLPERRWISVRNLLEDLLVLEGYTCFFAVNPNAKAFLGAYREEIDTILSDSPFYERSDECPLTMQPLLQIAQ